MGWLTNFLKCEYPCEWKCCKMSVDAKINRKFFWENMSEMNERDFTFLSSNRFIFEKVVHLKNKGTLRIGIDPENEFNIAGCLEVKSNEPSLIMNPKQLEKLFEFLTDNESYFLNSLPFDDMKAKYDLLLHQTKARDFDLYIDGYSTSIDEDSLKIICRMRLHIERWISNLENVSMNCETLFFKLLSHFCYSKTVKETCDLVETDYTQSFFEEIISFHCACLDKSFIIEIALHFEKWFSRCIPNFINTVMLYESERLRTFSSDQWPHDREVIDVQKLAKSGLYYVGTSDHVQCTFCNLVLHKWGPDDNPILDHFKYKPRCQFLINPVKSLNISDVGKQSDLEEMLSILKKKDREKESFDEVDQSNHLI